MKFYLVEWASGRSPECLDMMSYYDVGTSPDGTHTVSVLPCDGDIMTDSCCAELTHADAQTLVDEWCVDSGQDPVIVPSDVTPRDVESAVLARIQRGHFSDSEKATCSNISSFILAFPVLSNGLSDIELEFLFNKTMKVVSK